MKKLLISLLIGIIVLGVGCGKKSVDSMTTNVEVADAKVYSNEKREEFLQKVEDHMQGVADNRNKKYVEDKIEVRREDNVITYHMPYDEGETMTAWNSRCLQGDEELKEYAKTTRQATVTALNIYYDNIVEKIGDDYEFFIRSEKSSGGEIFQIIKIGKDNYEIEYDLLAEFGY